MSSTTGAENIWLCTLEYTAFSISGARSHRLVWLARPSLSAQGRKARKGRDFPSFPRLQRLPLGTDLTDESKRKQTRANAVMSSNLDKVQSVDIDPNGVFKYIQVEVKDGKGGAKRIVRGYGWAEYHGACLTCV